MTKHPDQNSEEEGQESEETQPPFEEYDEQIQEGLQADPRLDSGVPFSERSSDLDFIQMSGLTAPPRVDRTPPVVKDTEPSNDLDPNQPISFFEEGVADVDSSMAPAPDDAQPGYQPEPDNRAAMEKLRDMIAELTKDEAGPAASSELAPPTDAAAHELTRDTEKARPEPPVDIPPSRPEPERITPSPPEASTANAEPFELTPLADAADEASTELEAPEEDAEESEPPYTEAVEREIPVAREKPAPSIPDETLSARVYTPPPFKPTSSIKPEPSALPDDAGDRVRIPTMKEAEDAMYLRHSAPKTRRRSSGHRKHARQRVIRSVAGLIVVLALAAGGYQMFAWYEQRVSNPGSMYNEAAALAANERYREASLKYTDFAERNPTHALHADAQFAAAFTLQQLKPTAIDEQTRVYTRALELFQQFLADNPTHAKAPRARTLMGRLHYELGQYQEAIELLREPELRLLDPMAAVPAVRLLARSYAKLGQDDSARSYYLQAVVLQDNHTPDVDYVELGTLYRSMADRAPTEGDRNEYERLAAVQWTHAVQSSGIDPATKKELRAKINVLRERGLQGDVLQDGGRSESIGHPADESATWPTEIPWEATAPALDDSADLAGDGQGAAPPTDPDAVDAVPEPAEPEAPIETSVVEGPELEPLEQTPVLETVHYVVAGDTLSGIAAAHDVTVDELMDWNGLSQSMILVGQELVIHGPKPQASDPSVAQDENEEDNRDSTM
jgi:tetratricopeptide (TPR) repeat protein